MWHHKTNEIIEKNWMYVVEEGGVYPAIVTKVWENYTNLTLIEVVSANYDEPHILIQKRVFDNVREAIAYAREMPPCIQNSTNLSTMEYNYLR